MSKRCPKCNGDYGFYKKIRFVIEQIYEWDGTPVDANEKRVNEGTVARCCECNKRVPTTTFSKDKE